MEQQTVNEQPLFEASDIEPVANEPVSEQAETVDSSAVEATNEQTASENETSTEPAASTEAQTGDATVEFLAKKGIDSNDPDALSKVVKMYRDAEKGLYSKSQENAQLQRKLAAQPIDVRPDQEALNEVRSLRIEMDTANWKASRNLSPEDEQKMIDYITAPITDSRGNPVLNPTTGEPLSKGLLVNNGLISLDDVYKLAGCGKTEQVNNLKQDLREEVKKEMEARQAAKRPSANATNSTQFGQAEQKDPFLDGLFGN